MNVVTERIIQLGMLVFILGGWQLGVTAGFIDVF
ncbi:MAG: ABC transporter permease, partial [Pararhizobium sp.]